jgi:hypothetical protein
MMALPPGWNWALAGGAAVIVIIALTAIWHVWGG